jgi:CheY-like chemotaxis protein
VLIVDDNATNRRLLTAILRLWEMEPESASDADAAIETMRQAGAVGRPFQMVLTDAHMPGTDGFTLAERIKADSIFTSAIIMMLSSGGYSGEPARCREMGIAAYLTKPIQQWELKHAIIRLLQHNANAPEAPAVIAGHPQPDALPGPLVLLVEHHPVNQVLTARLLQKHGYEVVTAANGVKALAILENQRFQLALVDVQMPEMDGFQLTEAIRAGEEITGSHLPIIAMTAHALKGDRERCLAAGMDAYVSKPIDTKELLEAIESATRSFPSKAK